MVGSISGVGSITATGRRRSRRRKRKKQRGEEERKRKRGQSCIIYIMETQKRREQKEREERLHADKKTRDEKYTFCDVSTFFGRQHSHSWQGVSIHLL